MSHEPVWCPTMQPTRADFQRPFLDYVAEVFSKNPELPCFKVGQAAHGLRVRMHGRMAGGQPCKHSHAEWSCAANDMSVGINLLGLAAQLAGTKERDLMLNVCFPAAGDPAFSLASPPHRVPGPEEGADQHAHPAARVRQQGRVQVPGWLGGLEAGGLSDWVVDGWATGWVRGGLLRERE